MYACTIIPYVQAYLHVHVHVHVHVYVYSQTKNVPANFLLRSKADSTRSFCNESNRILQNITCSKLHVIHIRYVIYIVHVHVV